MPLYLQGYAASLYIISLSLSLSHTLYVRLDKRLPPQYPHTVVIGTDTGGQNKSFTSKLAVKKNEQQNIGGICASPYVIITIGLSNFRELDKLWNLSS